jgi:hypothetical protein
VQLSGEEMKHILLFFAYKSNEWARRGETTTWLQLSQAQAEAHCAYAHRQASMYSSLHAHCATLWKDIPAYIRRMQDIIKNPRLADPGEFDQSMASKSRIVESEEPIEPMVIVGE